jgi:hypothetical protein
MSKLVGYAVLAVLALAGSMFSCAHGGIVSSPHGTSLTIVVATLIA